MAAAMTQTFGEYLLGRRIDARTVNPQLMRRIQTTPRMADVTTFDELSAVLGKLSSPEEYTLRGFWRAYLNALRHAG